jgi:UDP-2,3-diacylglucosamine hydrolase
MNWGFRSPLLRKLFSWLVHPDIALGFGEWWSGKSRKSHSKETLTPDSLGFLVDYAREYKKANQDTAYILFGHMHYPYDLSEDNLRVLFLGCWDNDEATYAAMDDAGNISLKTF